MPRFIEDKEQRRQAVLSSRQMERLAEEAHGRNYERERLQKLRQRAIDAVALRDSLASLPQRELEEYIEAAKAINRLALTNTLFEPQIEADETWYLDGNYPDYYQIDITKLVGELDRRARHKL